MDMRVDRAGISAPPEAAIPRSYRGHLFVDKTQSQRRFIRIQFNRFTLPVANEHLELLRLLFAKISHCNVRPVVFAPIQSIRSEEK